MELRQLDMISLLLSEKLNLQFSSSRELFGILYGRLADGIYIVEDIYYCSSREFKEEVEISESCIEVLESLQSLGIPCSLYHTHPEDRYPSYDDILTQKSLRLAFPSVIQTPNYFVFYSLYPFVYNNQTSRKIKIDGISYYIIVSCKFSL